MTEKQALGFCSELLCDTVKYYQRRFSRHPHQIPRWAFSPRAPNRHHQSW